MARTERVLFTTPFYMLFDFFLLKYLFLLFGGISNWHILILTIIIGLMHFLPTLLETKKSRGITRFIARFYGFFVWCSLMFLIELIFINVFGLFISIPIGIIVLLLTAVPLFGLYNYHHAHQIKVKERTLKFENLKEDVNIVHLTDVHFGSLMHAESMKNLAEELKKLEEVCDLAIISGDLADGSCIIEEDSFMPLSDVDMPIIFSPGNHDFYPGIDNVFNACNAAGIIVLDNEQIGFKDLSVVGFSYSFDSLLPVSEQTLRDAVKEDSVNLMIYHIFNFIYFSKQKNLLSKRKEITKNINLVFTDFDLFSLYCFQYKLQNFRVVNRYISRYLIIYIGNMHRRFSSNIKLLCYCLNIISYSRSIKSC